MAKSKNDGRMLTPAQAKLFDKLTKAEKEKEERTELARALAEKIRKNEASRPDYDKDKNEALWEAAKCGKFVRIWLPEHGAMDGLVVRHYEIRFRKGVNKGEVARVEKHVFIPKGVTDNDERIVTLVAVVENEIISVGSGLKIPPQDK